jgi:hypothetical protein
MAPCGYELFGGGKIGYDATYQREVVDGNALEYRARFVKSTMSSSSSSSIADNDDGGVPSFAVVADREYNAREIAKSAMGTNSIVNTLIATPNRYSCVLAVNDAGGLISVDILALGRRVEGEDDGTRRTTTSTNRGGVGDEAGGRRFVCAEYVRQIVSRARNNNNNGSDGGGGAAMSSSSSSPLSVKEIETISIYDIIDENTIRCKQRTSTYLVPSQTDPNAFRRWQMSRGNAVDVRKYDVTYTRAG